MFIPRIYLPIALQSKAKINLQKDILHRLTKVLRLKSSAEIIVFNGEGGEYAAKLILQNSSGYIELADFNKVNNKSPLNLHLGQAIVRGDRMDTVMQKATELGITSITPLITKNCLVKINQDRIEKKLLHWQQIIISAAEQSQRDTIPKLNDPVAVNKWCGEKFTGTSVIFDTEAKQRINSLAKVSDLRFAIGPESGWTAQETELLITHDFVPCSLGPRLLRTETAAIAATTLMQSYYGDL